MDDFVHSLSLFSLVIVKMNVLIFVNLVIFTYIFSHCRWLWFFFSHLPSWNNWQWPSRTGYVSVLSITWFRDGFNRRGLLKNTRRGSLVKQIPSLGKWETKTIFISMSKSFVQFEFFQLPTPKHGVGLCCCFNFTTLWSFLIMVLYFWVVKN